MSNLTPSQWTVGIMVFSLIMFCGIYMIGTFTNDNPGVINTAQLQAFNETFNKINESTQMGDNLKAGVTQARPDFGQLGVLNGLINSAWNILKEIFEQFRFMDEMIKGIANLFEIPSQIVYLIIAIIGVMLVFSIYGAIFQKEV